MTNKKLTAPQIEMHRDRLAKLGEIRLYERAVGDGIKRFAHGVKSPEIELLDMAEAFFMAHRRGEGEEFFTIGRALRRAAHTVYRTLLKQKTSTVNPRFLNVVQ